MNTAEDNGKLIITLVERIDTNNAANVEKELMEICDANSDKEIVLDAKNLEYISSAGLRVLMKIRQKLEINLDILNVSKDVYDIFETTGFTELFNVHKRLRTISIDGLEKIGQGATADVYRIDSETIVKVFKEKVDVDMAVRENERAKAAFVAGIPTAISYDMIKVGNRYGTVFELLNAESLHHVLENDKPHITEHIERFAREIRSMHNIEVDISKFKDSRKHSLSYLQKLVGVMGTQEEINALAKMYEVMPERHTFIHGDCHPGNMMIQDNEYIFIDMSSSGYGHPVVDMSSMALIYKFPAMAEVFESKKKHNEYLRNFSKEEALLIWDTFLRRYLDTNDEGFIKKAEYEIMAYAALRTLFVSIAVPGLIPDEVLQKMKQFALGYCQNIEPLCFE